MAKASKGQIKKAAKKEAKKTAAKGGVKDRIRGAAATLLAKAGGAVGKRVSAKLAGGRTISGVVGGRAPGKLGPIARVKKRIKSALIRQARYAVQQMQPMRAAKILRKRFRVI